MGLFIDKYFSQDPNMVDITQPGKVILYIPTFKEEGSYSCLSGILLSEPTLTGSNKWGTILGEVSSNITDLMSLVGNENMFAWIGASTQCWKGTEPLQFSLDFYVVNYSAKLNTEDRVKDLMALTSLAHTEDSLSPAMQINIHGRYKAAVLRTNEDFFEGIINQQEMGNLGSSYNNEGIGRLSYAIAERKDIPTGKGTVIVQIGQNIKLANLLVSTVHITPSLSEVCSLDGSNIRPLYYRINVSFIGSRALLYPDVENMM